MPHRTPYRQSVFLLPALYRSYAFTEKAGDFLPATQYALRPIGAAAILTVTAIRQARSIQIQARDSQLLLTFRAGTVKRRGADDNFCA